MEYGMEIMCIYRYLLQPHRPNVACVKTSSRFEDGWRTDLFFDIILYNLAYFHSVSTSAFLSAV